MQSCIFKSNTENFSNFFQKVLEATTQSTSLSWIYYQKQTSRLGKIVLSHCKSNINKDTWGTRRGNKSNLSLGVCERVVTITLSTGTVSRNTRTCCIRILGTNRRMVPFPPLAASVALNIRSVQIPIGASAMTSCMQYQRMGEGG